MVHQAAAVRVQRPCVAERPGAAGSCARCCNNHARGPRGRVSVGQRAGCEGAADGVRASGHGHLTADSVVGQNRNDIRERASRASRECTHPADSTRLCAARERSCADGHPARTHTRRNSNERPCPDRRKIARRTQPPRSAAAKRRKVSLNASLIKALIQALGPRRVAESKEAR